MAFTRISANYPPQIDPTRTPLAYGSRAISRLNKELQDEMLLIRQRAVMSLCDHLHYPEHIATALAEGITESLKKLLSDPDITVRQKSTECLFVIAGHAIGRDAFLDHEIIIPISNLFNDSEDIARKNAHKTLEMISETHQGFVETFVAPRACISGWRWRGSEGIVACGLIPTLIEKLKTEQDEIMVLILDTLHFSMRVDTKKALSAGGMKTFTSLLQHDLPIIRSKAARDIMDLSVPLAGKDKAVEEGAIPELIKLLEDKSPDVIANAAGAIMTITVTTKGKYTAIGSNAIDSLVKLVDHSSSDVQLNSLKALTCLSAAPEGRDVLLLYIESIKLRTTDEIPSVSNAAKTAVKVITWKP